MSTSQSNVDPFQEGLDIAKPSPTAAQKSAVSNVVDATTVDRMQTSHDYFANLEKDFQTQIEAVKANLTDLHKKQKSALFSGQTQAEDDLVVSLRSIITRTPGLEKILRSEMEASPGLRETSQLEGLGYRVDDLVRKLETQSSEQRTREDNLHAGIARLQGEVSSLRFENSSLKTQPLHSEEISRGASQILSQFVDIDLGDLQYDERDYLMRGSDFANQLREEDLKLGSDQWLTAIPVSFEAPSNEPAKYASLRLLRQTFMTDIVLIMKYSELYPFVACLQRADKHKLRLALGVFEAAICCVKDKLDLFPPNSNFLMWYIRAVELLLRHYTSEQSLRRVKSLFEAAKSWLTTNLDADDNCLFAALYDQCVQFFGMSFKSNTLSELFLWRVKRAQSDIARHHPNYSFVVQGEYLLVVETSKTGQEDRSIRVIHPDALRIEWDERMVGNYFIAPDPAFPGKVLKMHVVLAEEDWYHRNFPKGFQDLFTKQL